MSDRTKLLFDQIMALSEEERFELLSDLEEAVYGDDPPPNQWPDEDALMDEIERRSNAYHDGTAVLQDSADVFRELEEKTRRERGG